MFGYSVLLKHRQRNCVYNGSKYFQRIVSYREDDDDDCDSDIALVPKDSVFKQESRTKCIISLLLSQHMLDQRMERCINMQHIEHMCDVLDINILEPSETRDDTYVNDREYNMYKFIQVHSVYNNDRRLTPILELFVESSHMTGSPLYSMPKKVCKSCDDCDIKDAVGIFVMLMRTQNELWHYGGILSREQRARFQKDVSCDLSVIAERGDRDNSATEVYTHNQQCTQEQEGAMVGVGARKKKSTKRPRKCKRPTIKEKMLEMQERAKVPYNADDAADRLDKIKADLYAKRHGGFTFNELSEAGLPVLSEFTAPCGMYAPHVHNGDRVHKVHEVFNHYVDDGTYIKYMFSIIYNAVVLIVRYSHDFDLKCHSTAYTSYSNAVNIALQMISNNGVETEGGKTLYRKFEPFIDLVLLTSGIRHPFGVMTIYVGNVYNVKHDLRHVGVYTQLGRTESYEVGGMSFDDKEMSSYTIRTMTDYWRLIHKSFCEVLGNQVCLGTLCQIMLENDGCEHKQPFDRRDKKNIVVKQILSGWFTFSMRHVGVMFDLSCEYGIGVYHNCLETHCNTIEHHHRLMMFVLTSSNAMVSKMREYLTRVRYISQLSDICGDHMRRMYIGDPKAVLTNAYIVPHDISFMLRTIEDITGNDGRTFTVHNKFGFVHKDFKILLQHCRNRNYEFLQLHGMHSFSFDKFMRVAKLEQLYATKRKTAVTRETPIHLFYIGNMHLMSPNVVNVNSEDNKAVNAIRKHLLLLGSSNIRFKTDVCVRRMTSGLEDSIDIDMEDLKVFNTFNNTYVENVHKDFKEHVSRHYIARNVSLNVLAGKMHAKYSSIGTMVSFIDRHALRLYKAGDIKLSYVGPDAQYLYYRAHSFLVTITGAFTKCADVFGERLESYRTCAESCSCPDGGINCHGCLHNIVFCKQGSVVERYMSAKFEEFLPYITALYMNYSFNGASTKECDLDAQVFKDKHVMLACDNSVEFLYHADSSKLANVQAAIQNGMIPYSMVEEILQDDGFCLMLLETVNETHGPVSTSTEMAYARLLRMYYHPKLRKDMFDADIHVSSDMKSMYYKIGHALKSLESVYIQLATVNQRAGFVRHEGSETCYTCNLIDIAHEDICVQRAYMEKIYKSRTHKASVKKKIKRKKWLRTKQLSRLEQHSDIDVPQDETTEQAAFSIDEMTAQVVANLDTEDDIEQLERQDTVSELLHSTHSHFRVRTHEDYLGKIIANSNDNIGIKQKAKHVVSMVKRRFMTQHHSFMSPGGNIGKLKRSNKPLHWRRVGMTRSYNDEVRAHPLRRSQSYYKL